MRLTFLGANGQVTGSRYCLEAAGQKVMIDCGLVQEREFLERNWEPCPVPADEFAAVLLTHMHIDHCGLVPKLVHEGFDNPIYATQPSVELSGIMLRDTAHIQMEDAAYKRRRHQKEGRQGRFPVVPLYTIAEVEKTLPLFRAVPYGERIEIGDSISATFHDAGHILGSAIIEIMASENGTSRRFLFSGDVGQWDKPLLRDPTLFEQADYVVVESTYGDRDHEDGGDIPSQLAEIINQTTRKGGNIVIPVFALERAQELMYCLSQLVRHDRIPHIPIYLDSPMAAEVTDVFRKFEDCFDEETQKLLDIHESPLDFPGLILSRTTDESKAINGVLSPCIIMSASGMCTAGRIKHHLRYNISRHECTILFVGYQGRGTLGRHILEGAREVRIHGKTHSVEARIAQIHGFSGHADRSGLLRWLGALKTPPRHVFVTHGEETSSAHFAEQIKTQWSWPVSVPEYGSQVALD